MTKANNKNPTMEIWDTPVSHAQSLWLQGVLQSITQVHMFFSINQEKNIHVMTFGRHLPYRFVEEEYAYHCTYDFELTPNAKEKKSSKVQRTWKVWNTPFIKDLDKGHALSHYKMVNGKHVRDEEIFEYFIITQDEWIEIIDPYKEWKKVEWEFFPNADLQKVIESFVNKTEW